MRFNHVSPHPSCRLQRHRPSALLCRVPRAASAALLRMPTLLGFDAATGTQVSTSDAVLICRPEITLDDNTNVASLTQFAGRKSTQARPAYALDTLLESVQLA